MKKIVLVFLFLFFPLWGISSLRAQIPDSEKEALIALYESTKGDEWIEAYRWDLSKTPDKWQGVKIKGGHVSELALAELGLKGSIPEGIFGKLPELESVDLGNNTELSGNVPQDITTLAKLKYLILSRTGFTGELPSLNPLTALEVIDISMNNYTKDPEGFTSTVPDFSVLPALYYFDASYSGMKGTIGEGIGTCRDLWMFDISGNFVEGELPASLANCTNIRDFSVQDNELSGEIPDLSSFVNLAESFNSMGRFFFNENHFSGPFPLWLNSLGDVKRISFANNELTGTIPDDLTSLTELETFFADHNKIAGGLPKYLPEKINFFNVAFNEFTGTIPETWENAKELNRLYVQNNRLSGKVLLKTKKMLQLEVVKVGFNHFRFDDFENWASFGKDPETRFYFGMQKNFEDLKEVQAKSGETVLLDATPTPAIPSKYHLRYTWYFGENMDELENAPDSPKLELKDLSKSNAGNYICLATTDFFGDDPTGELSEEMSEGLPSEGMKSQNEEEEIDILIPTMAIGGFNLVVDGSSARQKPVDEREKPYPYPSKTEGEVFIAHPEKVKSLSVFNAMGEKVFQIANLQRDLSAFDLSSCPSGSYLVLIFTHEGNVCSGVVTR